MNALAPVNSPKSSPFESSGARLASPDGRLLPLRSAHVDVEARGGIARVILTQRFANPSDAPLNVQYTLPLPADGAVSGFAFTVGERRIVGEVDRKASARDRFEAAVLEGRTAALIEQVRDSAFDQALGNVPPKGEVVCEVVVDQPLRWLEEGRWEWRFPTVVGPRYMGGEGLVPDADALTVDLSPKALKTRMSLTLVIADPDCIAVDSPSHTLSVTGDEVREVRFGGDPSVRLDRDLVVQWAVSAQTPGATLDAARPADGEHGGAAYGLITVTPPTATPPQATKARDLICLIDTSGSMGGLPLDQAKRVVSALIDGLGDDDRVELIEFGSAPRRFKTEPTAATRAGKKAALKWVRSLRASGATNMHTAVLEALHPLRPKAQRQVVLLTDGYIGFEQLIIGQLLRELPTESRLHVVGVGSAVNRTLTKGAARAGGGAELIIGLDEDAEKVAKRLLRRTESPLVTGLTVEGDVVRGTAPVKLPDLFAGCPALLSVALDPAGGDLVLRGDGADGPFERRIEVPALALGQGRQGVVSLYGREKVEDLETAISAGGDVQHLDAQIETAGLDFGIATRLTSWIAVTDAPLFESATPAQTVVHPQEVPHGVNVSAFGVRHGAAPPQAYARGAAPLTMTGACVPLSADPPAVFMKLESTRPPSPGQGRPRPKKPASVEAPTAAPPEPAPAAAPTRAEAKSAARRTRWTLWVFITLVIAIIAWMFGAFDGGDVGTQVTPAGADKAVEAPIGD